VQFVAGDAQLRTSSRTVFEGRQRRRRAKGAWSWK
jgi:hypothetical protein